MYCSVTNFPRQLYYKRTPEMLKRRKKPLPHLLINRNVNDCLTANDPDCFKYPEHLTEMQLTYFCGSAPECRTLRNKNALQKAKYNAEKYYSVIGILENLPLSWKLLELYLPKYFQNFTSIMTPPKITNSRASREGTLEIRQSTYRNELDPENVRKIEKWLETDLEFYQFVVQRLHNQAKLNKLIE